VGVNVHDDILNYMVLFCQRYWLWQYRSVYHTQEIRKVAHGTQMYTGLGTGPPYIQLRTDLISLSRILSIYGGADVQLPRVSMQCS